MTLALPHLCSSVSICGSPRPGARFTDRDGRRIVIVYVQEERGLIFIKFTSNGCPAVMVLPLYRQLAKLMQFTPVVTTEPTEPRRTA